MTPTPRTDAIDNGAHTIIEAFALCRQLELELAEIKEALWPEQTGLPNEHRNAAIAIKAIKELSARIIERLEVDLAESHAREAQLREVLESVYNKGRGSEVFPAEVDEHSDCSWVVRFDKVKSALTLPPPPVIPLEDVKPLVEAFKETLGWLENKVFNQSPWHKTLKDFTAKHPSL